jgi:hypothetical protein
MNIVVDHTAGQAFLNRLVQRAAWSATTPIPATEMAIYILDKPMIVLQRVAQGNPISIDTDAEGVVVVTSPLLDHEVALGYPAGSFVTFVEGDVVLDVSFAGAAADSENFFKVLDKSLLALIEGYFPKHLVTARQSIISVSELHQDKPPVVASANLAAPQTPPTIVTTTVAADVVAIVSKADPSALLAYSKAPPSLTREVTHTILPEAYVPVSIPSPPTTLQQRSVVEPYKITEGVHRKIVGWDVQSNPNGATRLINIKIHHDESLEERFLAQNHPERVQLNQDNQAGQSDVGGICNHGIEVSAVEVINELLSKFQAEFEKAYPNQHLNISQGDAL